MDALIADLNPSSDNNTSIASELPRCIPEINRTSRHHAGAMPNQYPPEEKEGLDLPIVEIT
jgi:hypothetical protein